MVILGFFLATATLGFLALSILSENKKRDFWALVFMSAEIRSNQISRTILDTTGANNPDIRSNPGMILRSEKNSRFLIVYGPGTGDSIDSSSLNLKENILRSRYNLLTYKGRTFVAQLVDQRLAIDLLGKKTGGQGEFYFFWPINLMRIFGAEAAADGPGVIYAVTTEGQLLVSTSRDITSTNFAKRRLVQRFINNQFRQGQLEYIDPNGKQMLGVFFQIPETNIVLFSETLKRSALAPVYQLRNQYATMAVITLLLTVAIVIFSLRPVVDPITDLVRVARRISAGDFSAKPLIKGIGETEVLNLAFEQMGNDLQRRDDAINRLHEEQKGKIRLEAELAVAKSIQDNFMPHDALTSDSHVQIDTSYTPAAEAAGDWYSYHHDSLVGESVVAI
ncbi:MAG: HAMP domain-containing protein, partial [Proteobacteria bacterium]|nr:HAMP domain-containing protein [Pseudomonadota bacterium]